MINSKGNDSSAWVLILIKISGLFNLRRLPFNSGTICFSKAPRAVKTSLRKCKDSLRSACGNLTNLHAARSCFFVKSNFEDHSFERNRRKKSKISENNQLAALITVKDADAGVPEELIENIFQPFSRVDDARDRESGGIGLGSAIVQSAIKLHNETITATNVSTGGFKVEIRLPLNAH